MKFCYTCKIYLSDDCRFCTQCGSSFALKYCPKLHVNHTDSEYCKVCGSSELSTPDDRPKQTNIGKVMLVAFALGMVLLAFGVVFISLSAQDALPPKSIVILMIGGVIVILITSRVRQRK